MNKTLKGIIGGSILLAMLGGVFAYLKLTEPEPAENSSSQSADSGIQTELFNAYSDDINQIEVKNPNGDSYIAVRRIDQTKTTDAEGNEKTEDIANYYLKGYEKLPMNTTQIRLLATRAGSVTSEDTVAEDVTLKQKMRFIPRISDGSFLDGTNRPPAQGGISPSP